MQNATAIEKARAAMIAKRFGGNANGAKSADGVRRNQAAPKAQHDDKKLSGALKKLNMQNLPGVEEVNIFQSNGNIIHFNKPKIQAMIPNVFVVSGNTETKPLAEMLPKVIDQLGPESIERLRKIAEQMGMFGNPSAGAAAEDDDVPELVENFEEAANK